MNFKVKKLVSGVLAFSILLGTGGVNIVRAKDTPSIAGAKKQISPVNTENKDKEEVNPYAITAIEKLKKFKNAYDKEKDIEKKQNMVKSELDKVIVQYNKTQNKEEKAALLLKLISLREIEKRTPLTLKQKMISLFKTAIYLGLGSVVIGDCMQLSLFDIRTLRTSFSAVKAVLVSLFVGGPLLYSGYNQYLDLLCRICSGLTLH